MREVDYRWVVGIIESMGTAEGPTVVQSWASNHRSTYVRTQDLKDLLSEAVAHGELVPVSGRIGVGTRYAPPWWEGSRRPRGRTKPVPPPPPEPALQPPPTGWILLRATYGHDRSPASLQGVRVLREEIPDGRLRWTWYLDPLRDQTATRRALLRYPDIARRLPEGWDAPRVGLPAVDLTQLDGFAFEQWLLGVFRELGYVAKLTSRGSDFGVDLIVEKDGLKSAVQAKHHKAAVGIAAVQEVHGGRGYYRCKGAIVVSTGTFTVQAEKLARRLRVELYDRRWITETMESLAAAARRQAE